MKISDQISIKFYMYEIFGTDPWVEYHYRVFCVLGDPSLHIWKNIPEVVNVGYPPTIPVGYNHFEIEITVAGSGQPVKNAQLCIVGEEFFETYTSNSSGIVVIDMETEVEEILTITVRGGNVYPFQGKGEARKVRKDLGPEGQTHCFDLERCQGQNVSTA